MPQPERARTQQVLDLPIVIERAGEPRGRRRRTTVLAVSRRFSSGTWLKLRVVADAFEQELLTDIAEAEAIGENDLAAEWRLELNTYRAAQKQAILEEQAQGGSSAVARREALGRRRSDQP
jgi:hypothetical protein